MSPQEEAERIVALVEGNHERALALVERQLMVIYNRAQVLVSVGGVVITVTGFSGRLIAATDPVAQGLLIGGLGLVVGAAFFVWLRVMRVKWITQDLGDDLDASVTAALERRNRKTSAFGLGGAALFAGLVLYCSAIALMLASPGPVNLPIR